MKNKSLVTITALSIVLFIGLVFAVYKIAGMNNSEFYQDGYVSVSDTDVSDKVYFKGGTVYKKGYNNEIIFKNTDDEKKEVSKYSFVYYNTKSISYLNDGVLMALDELDSDYIPYYNIKNNYIISYENGHYVIKTKTKDIILDNFIGRIDENKYLVAGNNLKLKLGSSEELINNYYFELNFVEGNQVKIDNDKINIKTIAEGSYIYVGNDVIIDLNNRIIKYKDNLKLNLSEITINSDENIDILYDSGQNNEIDDGNGGNGNGDGQGGNGNEGKENYEPEKVVEYKNVPYVELLSTNISSTRIRLDYKVVDTFKLINGDVTVRYMNLSNSEVNEISCVNYNELCVFDAQNLSSNTKYLITILTSYTRNGVLHRDFIMFQRTFQTNELNVSVEKDYVSSNGITYRVKMNNDSNFDSATLNLYDNSGQLVGSTKFNNNHQDVIVNFDGLKSNSSYTAKIEDLVIGNVTYKTSDYGSSTSKTLKYNPLKDSLIVNAPKASSNKKDYTFSFDLGIGEDKDHAIKEVTYSIYDVETNELVKTIKKENTAPFTFEVGEEFSNDKKYVYQATLKINDNEKMIYQKTLLSNAVSLTSKVSPYATFTRGEITANTLAGLFKIYDSDNTIDMIQAPYVEYVDSEGVKGAQKQLEYRDCGEDESATTKCVDLYLDGLTSDSTYTISLYSYVDLKDDPENENYIEPSFIQVGIIQVKTSEADIVYTNWDLKELEISELQSKVFEIDLRFSIDTETTSELVVDNMQSFDMQLYEGAEENEVLLKTIHVGAGVSIKNDYFDNAKTLTLSTFGYSLNDLITRHMADGTKISQRYTIKLTNGKSGIDYVDFKKSSFVFDIDPTLLEITNDNATVSVNLIKNKEAYDDYKVPELSPDTYVAMEIIPYFENRTYVTSIDYTIYDVSDNLKEYKFSHSDLDLNEENDIPTEMIKIYGIDSEEFLKRGHSYQVTYTLSLDLNGDGTTDIVYPLSVDITKPAPVKSSRIDIPKQIPTFVVLPWTSGVNENTHTKGITYKYDIYDIDSVLGENPNVMYSVGETSYTGDKENAICLRSTDVDKRYNYPFNCVFLSNLNNNDRYTIYFEGRLLNVADAPVQKFEVSDFIYEDIIGDSEISNHISFTPSSTHYNNLAVFNINDTTANDYYTKRIANYNLIIRTSDGAKRFVIKNVNDGNLYNNGTSASFNSNNSIEYYENGSKLATSNIISEPNLSNVAYVSYCDGVEGEECIFFDYAKLYNSTIFGNYFRPLKGQSLTIEIGYTYDTGKVGYYASSTKKYAFQIKTPDEILIDGTSIGDYYYIATTNREGSGSHYNFGALSGVYSYRPAIGGFVADSNYPSNGDQPSEEYIQNGRSGLINFTNGIFDGQSLNINYHLAANGVIININGYELPILAKELADVSSEYYKNVDFQYSMVIPAISANISAPTINGIRLWLQTYGYADSDVLNENGQYLYLEVYGKNNTNDPIRTIKLNEKNLISQSGTLNANKQFTLASTSNNYKYNVTKVTVNGYVTEDYSYDYINGVITINDLIYSGNNVIAVSEGMSIDVSYNIAIYGLDINTEYFYKAYMMIKDESTNDYKKTYLIDSKSKTYEEAKIPFKTLSVSDDAVTLRNVALNVNSLADYETRYLDAFFTIGNDNASEIIGFEDFIYELSYNGKVLNIDSTNACQSLDNNYYATLNKSCVTNDLFYGVSTFLDVSNGKVSNEDGLFNFIFGTDYNLVIKAKVVTTLGEQYVTLFDEIREVRKLEEPTIDVTKRSSFNGKNLLTFEILFKDPDRVITGFTYVESEPNGESISVDNGKYLVHLGKNTLRNRVSYFTTTIPALNDEDSFGITYDHEIKKVNTSSGPRYDEIDLEDGKDYYLIINYNVNTNNLDAEPKRQELVVPIYTLDDDGVALGKVSYFASNKDGKGVSELTFSYATNINNDFPDQEAYVAGMLYSVSVPGLNLVKNEKVLFVDNNDPNITHVAINYVTNDNASSDFGENYYQIILNHTEYLPNSSVPYDFTFYLYLGGNIASEYTNEYDCTHTYGEPNANYWDNLNGKCYILSDLQHNYSTLFKGSTTGGE